MTIERVTVGGSLSEQRICSPEILKTQLPLPSQIAQQIAYARHTIRLIVHRADPRLLIVCGPCSIHDTAAALEYGRKLKELANQVQDQFFIVMRTYFEKPRTSLGWKGFINDPNRDHTYDIETGLQEARKLLLTLSKLDLPLATEALDPTIPLYLGDLISWAAIGARTAESQIHRELASGLSIPFGFKNSTSGSIEAAIHTMCAVAQPHHFIGTNSAGQLCALRSTGNAHTHAILRGGLRPNYDAESVKQIESQFTSRGMTPSLMIDCSHGNCGKNYRHQIPVAQDVINQIINGNRSIIGLMLESHLYPGNQSPYLPPDKLQYGISVTDPCLGLQETEMLVRDLAQSLRRMPQRGIRESIQG